MATQGRTCWQCLGEYRGHMLTGKHGVAPGQFLRMPVALCAGSGCMGSGPGCLPSPGRRSGSDTPTTIIKRQPGHSSYRATLQREVSPAGGRQMDEQGSLTSTVMIVVGFPLAAAVWATQQQLASSCNERMTSKACTGLWIGTGDPSRRTKRTSNCPAVDPREPSRPTEAARTWCTRGAVHAARRESARAAELSNCMHCYIRKTHKYTPPSPHVTQGVMATYNRTSN